MSQSVRRYLRDPDCDEAVRELAQSWLKGRTPGERAIRSADGAVGVNASRTQVVAPAERRLLLASGYEIPDDGTGQFVNRAIIGGSVCCTRQYGENQKRDSFTLFTRYGVGRIENICFLHVHGELRCFIFLRKCTLLTPLLILKHAWTVKETDALMVCSPSDVRGNAIVVKVEWNGENVFICAKQPNKVEKD